MKVHMFKNETTLNLTIDGFRSMDELRQVVAYLGLNESKPAPVGFREWWDSAIRPEDTEVRRYAELAWNVAKEDLAATARLRGITPEDITALRQSLEGWRHIMETFGKGEYFTSGWAGKQIESLLARIGA